MNKFAVVGNPINHSLSPMIHNEFSKQFSIDISYEKLHSPIGDFVLTAEKNQIKKGSKSSKSTRKPVKNSPKKANVTTETKSKNKNSKIDSSNPISNSDEKAS